MPNDATTPPVSASSGAPAAVVAAVLQAGIGADEPWIPAGEHPSDDGRRWLVGDTLVQAEPSSQTTSVDGSADWLAAAGFWHEPGFVVEHGGERWAVTTLDGRRPGDDPSLHPHPDRVPGLIGAALRELHDVDPAQCPTVFDEAALVARLDAAVSAGSLDVARLDAPYNRYEPADLLAMFTSHPGQSTASDAVIHGALSVRRLLVADGQRPLVLAPTAAGIGDRHRDLATLGHDLHRLFGPDAVFAFHEAYGTDPDMVALDRQMLLHVLLRAVPA
ncbi:MAG: phosphotransferase [Actinomycetota bacterium]